MTQTAGKRVFGRSAAVKAITNSATEPIGVSTPMRFSSSMTRETDCKVLGLHQPVPIIHQKKRERSARSGAQSSCGRQGSRTPADLKRD